MRNKSFFLNLIILLCVSVFLHAGPVQHLIQQIPSSSFEKKKLFTTKIPELSADLIIKRTVSKYDLMRIDESSLFNIANEKPENIELNIPILGVWQTLLLTRNKTVDQNTVFGALSNVRELQTITYKTGAYYVGIIKNDPKSVVAVSFFEHDIIGIAANDAGNFVIGRSNIKDYNTNEYIVYNDHDLLITGNTDCATEENPVFTIPKPENSSPVTETISTKCVKVYIECDYQCYLDHANSTTLTMNYATGIFNMTTSLYYNDSISTGISQINVWTTTDPYASSSSTSSMLNVFSSQMSSGFNGDLAHLFSTRPAGGGIAWTDVLCYSPYYQTAVSGSLGNTLTILPLYSWNANVVTHEMGHNLGSKHTHSCVWNGNNTRIDNCGGHAGYTSGTCADVFPDPILGGTMMSYCHLLSGIGINFNLGFGPQPGTLIRANVNAATCLTTCSAGCNSDITVVGVLTNTLTESTTWIKTSGQTTISGSADVKFDADPVNGYILIEPASSSDFLLSQPSSVNYFVAQALDGCSGAAPFRIKSSLAFSENEVITGITFNLYPNPARDHITLVGSNIVTEINRYEIITIEGKIRQSGENIFNGTHAEINIASLIPGLYFIKIIKGNNIESMKFEKF